MFFPVLIGIGLLVTSINAQVQCPPTGITGVQDPNSCIRFYRCINGNAVLTNCAPGMAFSATIGDCAPEAQANCNLCLSNSELVVKFVANERHCDRYTRCVGRAADPRECGPGFFYNPTSTLCDIVGDPVCLKNNPPPAPTPLPPNPLTDDPQCFQNGLFEIISSRQACERYTICACGSPITQQCGGGLIFDVVQRKCNSRQGGARCVTDPGQCPPNFVGEVAHPHDCRFNYLCVNGQSTLRVCPPGTEVDRQTGHCDLPHIAKCSPPSTFMQEPMLY